MTQQWKRSLVTSSIGLLFAVAAFPQTSHAQRVQAMAGVSHQATIPFASELEPAFTRPPLPRVAEGEKDPMIAGVLSLILPGAGSFYAGNSPHGIRHLAIEVASYAVLFGACNPGSTVNGCGAALGLSYVALLGNTCWAIVTAVGDARKANSPGPKKVSP